MFYLSLYPAKCMYTPHWLLYAFSTRHGCRLQSDDDDDDDDDDDVADNGPRAENSRGIVLNGERGFQCPRHRRRRRPIPRMNE